METSRGFQRIIAIALLVLVVLLVWRAGLDPAWRAWREDREAVASHRDAIARLRGLAAAGPRYQKALTELRQRSGFADALIRAPSATLAAAQLQQRVKALVEQAGGSMVSAQPAEAQAAGPFTRVGLGVRVTVSVAALQKVLHSLETRTPVVVIDEMLVLSRAARRSRRRVPVRDELDVRLTLSAFAAPSLVREPG